MAERYVIGVDVGTGSARAGLFDEGGLMLASAAEPIHLWRPKPGFAEQSSEDIWRAVGVVVRSVVAQAAADPASIAGIGFDATCSLVAMDAQGQPVPVNDEGVFERNIIVWMDHRAISEAERINAGRHEVLRYVGGRISPEMETPKLAWVKAHLPDTWKRTAKWFDLADYLTWRASGSEVRSLCTVVCKWTYLGHEGKGGKWDRGYFRKIGIGDLFEGDKIGSEIRPMGQPLGGLSKAAAKDLGLTESCVVSVGIIDAHAGGLGLLGAAWEGKPKASLADLETALAFIGGTSNCLMAVSQKPRYIDGVWGPYFGAMVPGMWLTEAGQSAAGSAIDHVIGDHAFSGKLAAAAKRSKRTVYELLNDEVLRLQRASGQGPEIVKDLHILPDFIGNRSPKADPHVRGIYDGLDLAEDLSSLALRYYATLQAVAYGIRDNIEALNASGYRIKRLYVTGGGTKNPLWLQEHADATGCAIRLPKEPEAVLLGSAILGATAAGIYPSIYEAMRNMSGSGEVIRPRKRTAAYHRAKYRAFQSLYREQARRRALMASF